MPFANSSSVQVGIIPETVFGVTPVGGNYRRLRLTGESLDFAINKEASMEINSSRAVSSMIPLSASASGGTDHEVSYQEYDLLLASLMQSAYAVFGTNGVGATFVGTFTATTITAAAATTGTSLFTSLQPGQFFRLAAPGHANDGKIFRNSLTVAATSTVLTVDPSTPLDTGTSIAACTLGTSRLTHGTTQSSFSIERQSADIGEYWCYKGMTPATMALSLNSGARTTMNFTFMGKSATRDVATQLPGVPVESYGYDIHSGVTGPVCLLWVDGAPLAGTYVQSMTLNFDNALREQSAICELGAVGIGSGTINCSGTMEVYFANGALFDKFAANLNSSVTFSTLDDEGNGYVFSLPKASLSKVSTSAGGKDADMVLSIEFTALRDLANANAALRRVLFIDRVGVAAV